MAGRAGEPLILLLETGSACCRLAGFGTERTFVDNLESTRLTVGAERRGGRACSAACPPSPFGLLLLEVNFEVQHRQDRAMASLGVRKPRRSLGRLFNSDAI